MAKPFPSPKLRLALAAYSALWWVLMPVILAYLWRRGRKDPLYAQHIRERFGYHAKPLQNPVWVHAVSLGEMRSATPLIRKLLERGDSVVTTHFTPAGRREAAREFATEIAAGQLQSVWVPLEIKAAYRRFLTAFKPRYGLVMEIEIWPRMIMATRGHGTPLFMCNAQYPRKSYDKDRGGLRAELLQGFAGGFVKSAQQQERFANAGLPNIHVTGELRFDQPIPQNHLNAARKTRKTLASGRPVITLTSVVEGEDALYLDMIRQTPDTLFIYVPRAPERFDSVAQMIDDAGLQYARRSTICDDALTLSNPAPDINILLGDSMGEMYFYLGLCDRAIVGGGFVTKGAHNIIEPLALKKPVIVGPHIWTIEYPATEAIAAGVCTVVNTGDELLQTVNAQATTSETQISAFYNTHAGGVERTLAAIDRGMKLPDASSPSV